MHVHAPGCGCKGLHANASLRRDPTRTIYIRAKYEADLVRRFTRLKRQIITAVGTENGFGLQANQDAVAPPRFNFPRSADKVDAFMTWLEDQEYAGILETTRGTPLRSAAQRSWQNVYINSAYQKGIAQAAGLMRGDGVDVSDRWIDAGFLRPIHADAVGLIHTRAYNELQGITDVMDQQISRTLALGLAEGRGPMDIARKMVDRVDAIGITRARMLARTETIAAHADSTLNTYDEAGLEGVSVMSEFSTAGDDQVCPECAALEGREYSIDEARGLIPLHPNCRCAWLPIVRNPRGIVLH